MDYNNSSITNVYDFYINDNISTFETYNDDIAFILDNYNKGLDTFLNSSYNISYNYKSRMFKDWSYHTTLSPTPFDQIKIALVKNNKEVAWFIFDATKSNNSQSWFSINNLIDSKYYPLQAAYNRDSNSFDYFSIEGDITNQRYFYISGQSTNSCTSNHGWLVIEHNDSNICSSYYSPNEGLNIKIKISVNIVFI